MPRRTVKLLLLDEQDRLLLIRSRDPATGEECWYPVGGGIEAGETLDQAASRETAEETGLVGLAAGTPVWTRTHTYRHGGREYDVHETWLLICVPHFEPAPAALSDHESSTIQGFRWWRVADLQSTHDTVFPPRLGHHLAALLQDGLPTTPVDITA